jgi:hypothetical protein
MLVLLVAGGLGVGFLIGTGNQHTITTIQMVTTTLTVTPGTHFATPVTPAFTVGGEQDVGTMCFTLPLKSQSSLNVTASMPYTGFSNYTTAIEYSFAPFPLDSTFPSWLHLSMSPPYVVMQDGKNVTATLQITFDSSVQNGQTGNFAIHANFNDPESGSSVEHVMVVEVVASSSASVAKAC